MKEKPKDKRDLARTRKSILDAAAGEFSDNGLAGARVDEIARRAGVSKAMIYYAFGGKEDLHLAVIENLFEEKTENIDAKVSAAEISQKDFETLLADYYDAFMDRQDYARIMINDVITGGAALRKLSKKRPDLFEIFDKLSTMLDASSKIGLTAKVDPDKGVMIVILILSSLVCMFPNMDLARPDGSQKHKDLADAEQWKAFLTDMIHKMIRP